MSGFELLEQMKDEPRLSHIPVIVYTGKELSKKQETELRRLRRDDHHQGREVAGPAARRDRAVPAPRREQPAGREAQDARAAAPARSRRWPARKALIVDDDIRNIFALTSVLEQHDMEVLLRGERPGRHPRCSRRRRTSTWC